MDTKAIFGGLGLTHAEVAEGDLSVHSPIDGCMIGQVVTTPPDEIERLIEQAHEAFLDWREVPPPRRGELIRLFAETLRRHKTHLGELVCLETGKIRSEGLGEVQEMVDICDFAVGLSRQLYGRTIASERSGHRMMETWHPLGVCGVISAFNFPVAVWSWNFAVAMVCGDPVVWKPAPRTPLTALACRRLFEQTLSRFGEAPAPLLSLIIGGAESAGRMLDHPRVALVSATGSCRMGRAVAPRVAARMGRLLLELGGNNAIVVAPSADLALAVRAIVFGAVGTAGQRCTSTRRLIVHEVIYAELLPRLHKAFASVAIGDPLEPGTLMGPLIDGHAFESMQTALGQARREGGTVHGGERVLTERYPDAYYVEPAIVEMPEQSELMRTETFAPILYVLRYDDLDQAIELHNAVPQGLSSAIFTNDLHEAERFLSASGSDCGIANVNIGTSGAEIGGAFGGEKDTGGGRESGSDAWKSYMRRATNTINYSTELPLAQGVSFELAG